MYQRVQYLVGRAVADRAGAVPRGAFARVWERPGYARRVGRSISSSTSTWLLECGRLCNPCCNLDR